jgi:hypothetical protein
MKTRHFPLNIRNQTKMRIYLLTITALGLCHLLAAQTALEQWQDYFPFTGTHTVVKGNNQIFCANAHMVFSYSLMDNSIEKATKVNQLSAVRISTIGFDNHSGTLVVGYENGNLDLIRNGRTYNLNSIQNSSIFGIKRINHVFPEQGRAYLSTGFGIVYIDLQNEEVIDSYIIGPGGANLQINAVTKQGGYIYAATDIGLMRADAANTFLANFNNWSVVNAIPNHTQEVSDVVAFGNRVVILQRGGSGNDDVVYYSDDGEEWIELRSEPDMRGLDVSAGRLAIKNEAYVEVLTGDLQYEYLVFFGYDSSRLRCNSLVITSSSDVWLGDERRGLRRFNPFTAATEDIRPVGPRHTDGYQVHYENKTLFKTSGAPASNWTSSFNPRGIEVFRENKWSTYDNSGMAFFQENGIRDLMVVAVHPDDENRWFVGSWGYGLLEFFNGEVVNWYNDQNSPLSTSSSTPDAAVGGLVFDNDKNLWMTNGNSQTPVVVLDNDGEWHAYSGSDAGAAGSNLYSQILIAQSGYKWIVRPRGHGLVVYDDNNTIDDSSDDRAIAITNQTGQGNLPTMDVFTVAEDLNGEIWVGTGEGIAVFYAAGSVFSNNNFDAQQILLEQDGNIQILLETEQVRSIAIDGANRKWLGTAGSGVFLMSPDGTEQVYHFTTANSPLPSNNVVSITINGESGEVFFSTDNGVVSFKSTATDGLNANTCRKVYPNPVRPGYDGPIAIEGLERNTNVKITDVAGNLVFETTSEGGQAIWNGRNVSGVPVTTGVYTALCVAPEANSTCVAKIMVIR